MSTEAIDNQTHQKTQKIKQTEIKSLSIFGIAAFVCMASVLITLIAGDSPNHWLAPISIIALCWMGSVVSMELLKRQ